MLIDCARGEDVGSFDFFMYVVGEGVDLVSEVFLFLFNLCAV